MSRKLAAVFLLSFLIVAFVATSVVMGADKPIKRFKDRASFPARFAPTYGFNGAESGLFEAPKNTQSVALGPVSTDAIGTQIGITTYDYQHNCTMGRQVEHRGTNYIHFDWTRQTDMILGGNRGMGVESYNLTSCNLVYGSGGKIATVDYGGYVTMDADQGGCAVPGGHEGPNSDAQRPRAYWDFCAGGPFGLFSSDYPSDLYGRYQNNGNGTGAPVVDQNLWPVVELQVGTETVLHMVCAESGGSAADPETISYYRRVGPYGAGVPADTFWSDQRVIDTAMNINPTVTASTTSDKVAIVWNAPADYLRDQGLATEYQDQYENDVWFAISNNEGADWIAGIGSGSIGHSVDQGIGGGFAAGVGGNITEYSAVGEWKAYCDMAALITSDDNLHIVWGARRWTDTTTLFRRQSSIFHWSEDVPYVRTVVKADWDTGGTCYGHAWGSDVAKMSISECDGKLYILFTQFGNAAQPCYDYDAVNNVENGELYMTASNDNGLNWDKAQNLTNSETPGCATGDCNSDYWASMARFGRTEVCGALTGQPVLDVLYINDKSPGGCVQTESGVWTTNPVMWFPTPCRAVVEEPGYTDNAGTGYGECYSDVPLVVQPNSDTMVTLTMENPGLQDNAYTITESYTNGSGWISAVPSSGTIFSGLNNTVDVDLTFTAPTGAPDPSVWVGEIQVTHQADGSPRIIPVCLLVASDFTYPESAVLQTTCKKVKIFNTGELVNNAAGEALDFIGDCDTFNVNTNSKIYLYDGSPIVTRVNGNGDTLRFMMYSKTFTDPDGMRPLTPLTVDNSNVDYSFATAMFATADTTIGFISEYYVPKAAGNCSFIVEKLKFFNMTNTAINGVYVGEILDWDVPSDSGSNNGSGFDLGRDMIYQFGGEYGQDDSTEALCAQNQQSNDRYAAIAAGPNSAFKNGYTLDNATYIYSSGPYGSTAPMPPQATYDLMSTGDGFSTFSSAAPESLYTDLTTLVTFGTGAYDLTVGDTFCVTKILSTSKEGLTYLNSMVDNGKTFITNEGIECPLLTCCINPGDANHDGSVNIGDAVFIINYVFKHGLTPSCLQEADANHDGSINIGDAVYIINFVFKHGLAPQCGP